MKTILSKVLIVVHSIIFPHTSQGISYIKSFLNVEQDPLIEEKVDSLLNLSDEKRYSDPTKSMGYAKKAYQLSEVNLYDSGIMHSLFRLGLIHRQVGHYDKALESFESILGLLNNTTDSLPVIRCYNEIGLTYQKINDYTRALENLTYAANKAESLNFCSELPRINLNIAKVLFDQGDHKMSISYLKPLLRNNLDNSTRAAVHNSIGRAYYELKDTEQALKYYGYSYKICLDIEGNPCELKPLGNMASIYLARHEYDRSLEYFLKIMKVEEELDLKRDLIATYNSIGIAYRLKKDFNKGLAFIDKSEKLAKEIRSSHQLKTIYLSQAVAHEDAGNYLKAIDYLYLYRSLSDSLFNTERSRQIAELLIKFEAEKKEKEITLLKKDKELQSALLKNQQIEMDKRDLVQKSIALGVLFLLIVGAILLYSYYQKLKAKELLAHKNEEITSQKTLKLIRDHEINSIKANMKWQEKEKERISSELHDGIAASIAAIKLGLVKIAEEGSNRPELQSLIQSMNNTYDEIRSISHNLSPPRMTDTPFIDLIENYLNEIAGTNFFEVEFFCNPKREINQISDEIKVGIYRMIQEIMNNIIKHAHCEYVELRFTGNKDHLNIMVEDNGKGFDINRISYGMGLNNITSRIKTLNGDLHIDSSIGRGTIINIDIPIGPAESSTSSDSIPVMYDVKEKD